MLAKTRTGIDGAEFGGGISAEFLGGAAALTLGILAIVRVGRNAKPVFFLPAFPAASGK